MQSDTLALTHSCFVSTLSVPLQTAFLFSEKLTAEDGFPLGRRSHTTVLLEHGEANNGMTAPLLPARVCVDV
jgi:hypothetical protein